MENENIESTFNTGSVLKENPEDNKPCSVPGSDDSSPSDTLQHDVKEITQFSNSASEIHWRGCKFKVDPLDARAYRDENLLPILPWEHLFSWAIFEEKLFELQKKIIKDRKGLAIDVGSGTGFYSVMANRLLGLEVHAIDKNERAFVRTEQNLALNTPSGEDFRENAKVIKQHYGKYSCEAGTADLIFLNPPCHIYPEHHEYRVPIFARSGWDGLDEFYDQVQTGWEHLSDDGVIMFTLMSGGDDKKPGIVKGLEKYLDTPFHLEYTHLYRDIPSKNFLYSIYDDKKKLDQIIKEDFLYGEYFAEESIFTPFFEKYHAKYPRLYLVSGLLRKSKKTEISRFHHGAKFPAQDNNKCAWGHRILTHRNIIMY